MKSISYLIEMYLMMFAASAPIAVVAMYIPMTQGYTPKERFQTAKSGCFVALIAFLIFAIAGNKFLRYIGVDINAFKVAGGLVLLFMGFELMRSKEVEEQITEEERKDIIKKRVDISATPLGVPLILGPGCISSFLVYQSRAENFVEGFFAYVAGFLIIGTFYVMFYFACISSKWLKPTFVRVSGRLTGLLVIAIAVQFIAGGLKEFFFS